MSDPSRALRRLLESHVRNSVPRGEPVALLLSAGIDSTAVGLAAHHLGHEVHAYTFRLGPEATHDSRWAERTASIMGWPWTVVQLPTSVHHIVDQWPRLYRELHCRKKREFECAWPFLWTYPRVRQKWVLNGLGADAYFVPGRKGVRTGAAGKDGDPRVFDRIRREYCEPLAMRGEKALSVRYNPNCMLQHLLLQREFGLSNVDPYSGRAAFDFFMRFSWQDLNLPVQKQFLRGTYPSEFARVGIRRHQNYQHAGRISDHFEKILDTPINYRHRRRVIDCMTADWSRPSRAVEQLEVLRAIEHRLNRSIA